MFRAIFDGVSNFVDHLGATGSIFLALAFAMVMYLLQLGANKGQKQQAKTQLHLEYVEKHIEELILHENGKIPLYLIEEYPFNVFFVCRRMRRKDLITSKLRWQLLKTGTFTFLFLICYFSIFGLIIFAIMRGLGKI